MTIKQAILTQNDGYKKGQTIRPYGIILHSVGCPQPSAEVWCRKWNKPGVYVNAHACIDGNSGDVWQFLPWNLRGWHAAGSANDTHIGVEMGEPATLHYTGGDKFTVKPEDLPAAQEMALRTYRSAVELFAQLCKAYQLDPIADRVILSHKEAGKLGIASKHTDPGHLWRGLGMDLTMDRFRQDVKAAMEPQPGTSLYRVQVGAFRNREYAEAMVRNLAADGYPGAFIIEVPDYYT